MSVVWEPQAAAALLHTWQRPQHYTLFHPNSNQLLYIDFFRSIMLLLVPCFLQQISAAGRGVAILTFRAFKQTGVISGGEERQQQPRHGGHQPGRPHLKHEETLADSSIL